MSSQLIGRQYEGKFKCSKSNSESRKPELRANDGFCRTLMRRACISESLIPTGTEGDRTNDFG